ncbi:YmL10 [Vermiconidia calcicola]|uniref:YmL10 n=1 Tax=Vermiconidia calcicola TaxID=1690605 RepID=A0ACC3NSL2_9PEZI|nr:YmL10 [Vermiconidia calcicola]
MPPRLQLLSRASAPSYQPLAPFLYPFISQQRSASILASLSDNQGAYNKKIRRGRGPSSGKGKTSGRGHKGQKQHGKVPVGFNGGQTKDEVVAGPRGFVNRFSTELSPINLNKIQHWITTNRLDPTQPITLKELSSSRCLHGVKKDGVKLLARGKEDLHTPIHIVVSRASASAIAAVEKAGGTVTTRYYTPFAVSKIKQGVMDPIHSLKSRIELPVQADAPSTVEELLLRERQYRYKLPDPASRKALEYYRDEAHRGYLSYLVGEGQGPSLYFRTPGEQKFRKKVATGKGGHAGVENRLW